MSAGLLGRLGQEGCQLSLSSIHIPSTCELRIVVGGVDDIVVREDGLLYTGSQTWIIGTSIGIRKESIEISL